MAAYVDLPKYRKHLAGCVAERLIKNHFTEVYKKVSDPFEVIMGSRLEYGRGGPKFETTLKALQNAGVIWQYNRQDLNAYNFYAKADYRYFIKVVPEWYEEYAKTIETEPKFELQKTIKEYGKSGAKERAVTEKDGYREVISFEPGETIYILNHLDDYDFIPTQRSYNNKRLGIFIRKYMMCYPKAQRGDLARDVFDAHVEKYLKKHFEWIVKLVFGIEEDVINRNHPHLSSYITNFNDPNKFTKEKVEDRICSAIEGILYYQKVLPVLKKIKKGFDQFDGTDIFAEGLKRFREYLEECYPCHLEDEDEDLKQLAQWMMYGKHEGQPTKVQMNVA
jgi:hypothetical protein